MQAAQRRDEFARLVAADLARGGLDEAHRNVVEHRRACRIDPDRALRLQFDAGFVAQVHRLAGYGGGDDGAQSGSQRSSGNGH